MALTVCSDFLIVFIYDTWLVSLSPAGSCGQFRQCDFAVSVTDGFSTTATAPVVVLAVAAVPLADSKVLQSIDEKEENEHEHEEATGLTVESPSLLLRFLVCFIQLIALPFLSL